MRPTTGPIRREKQSGGGSSASAVSAAASAASGAGRHAKRKPPRGMYLDHDDLVTFAGDDQPDQPGGQSDAVLKGMNSEIVALKRLVQKNKQVEIPLSIPTLTVTIDHLHSLDLRNREIQVLLLKF